MKQMRFLLSKTFNSSNASLLLKPLRQTRDVGNQSMYTVTRALPCHYHHQERVRKLSCNYISLKEWTGRAQGGKLHFYFNELGKSHGPLFQIQINILRQKIVVVNSSDLVYKILGDETEKTSDRMTPFFQKGVFNDNGFSFANYSQRTEKQKRILMKYLNTKYKMATLDGNTGIKQLITSCFDKSDSFIDTEVHLKTFLADVFTNLLMGETLPEDDPDRNALWELINCLYLLIEPSNDGPLRAMPFLRHLPGKHGRLFRSTIKARDRVALRYFDTQKSTFQEGRIRGLIDVCLQMQADGRREEGGEFWLTDEYIKGLVYDTVVAGMTEMMKSLRILVLLMCHHQDIQSRVHTEINDVIREDTPSCSHRQEMPYTQAVILEMLRYVSQTPLAIPHKCNKDIILDGYLIEKDSGILPNIWGIHHDEEVWGDPWVFRPERFLDENNQLIPKDHKLMKSLIPFSVGKRRCPGENFAMSRTFLTFVSLLQQLRFAPPEDQELPSADPRLYTNKYPLHLPKYTCRAVPRREEPRREEPRSEEKSS